jgi:hypothetical protein
MAIDKQVKPDILIPDGFGGVKTEFDKDKLENGFQESIPQILAGDNLNNLINMLYKYLLYTTSLSDFVNGTPINKVPSTDKDNKLVYVEKQDPLTAGENITIQTVDGKVTISAILSGSGMLGEIKQFDSPQEDSTFLKPLNEYGAKTGYLLEHADTDYSDFWNYCLKRKQKGLSGDSRYARYAKTQSEYNLALSKNMLLGKTFTANWVIDEINKTIRLPFIGDAFTRGLWNTESEELKDMIQDHAHSIDVSSQGYPNGQSDYAAGNRYWQGQNLSRDYPKYTRNVDTVTVVGGTIRTGSETRTRSIGMYYYIVTANTSGEVNLVDLQGQLQRYTNDVIKPEIKEAGEEAAQESKDYAEQAAASAEAAAATNRFPYTTNTPRNTNFNEITTAGFYRLSFDANRGDLNQPYFSETSGSSWFVEVYNTGGSSSEVVQTAYGVGVSGNMYPYTFRRRWITIGWSAWSTIALDFTGTVDYVTSSWTSSGRTSWYYKYKSGRVIMGGSVTASGSSATNVTINFPTSLPNNEYTFIGTYRGSSSTTNYYSFEIVGNRTTTSTLARGYGSSDIGWLVIYQP